MDIVRIFETWCNDNDIEFGYGSENHLNLIESESAIDPEKIYLLLFPVSRQKVVGQFSFTPRYDYSGKFMLLVSSSYSEHYFSENKLDPKTSKYTKNIEPLLETFDTLERYIHCQNLEVKSIGNVDAVNVLDANKDGLWCNFKIQST